MPSGVISSTSASATASPLPDDLPAPPARTRVVVLGSTGSVGRSALNVIADDGGARLRVWGLGARSNWESVVDQARAHRPRYVALADPAAAACAERALRGSDI